jgi:cell division inhibitor SepF
MPGAMRKLGLYLGLVEDDEDGRDRRYAGGFEDGYDDEAYDAYDEPVSVRGGFREDEGTRVVARRSFDTRESRGAVALDTAREPSARTAPAAAAYEDSYRITTLQPRTYNEARTIGEHFRAGTPVIMNLTEMDDTDAKRLVDFAAGLIFGLHGSIERVTNKVFLLSPEHVQVTAEDKARIAESGFFNQS